MRRMVWLTIGFGSACAVCANFLWSRNLAPAALLAAALGVVSLGISRKHTVWKKISASLFGVCLGFFWFSAFNGFYLRPLEPLDRTTVPLTITATDYSRRTQYSYCVTGTTKIEGKSYRLIVYLKGEPDIHPGDVLTSEFRLRVTAPAGENDSNYYQGLGCFLTATQKADLEHNRPGNIKIRYFPAVFAKNIKETLTNCFPSDTAAFAKSLLLGDSTGLSYSENTAMKVSGIRHIAAVSGLHVSLIFGLVLLLCSYNIRLTLFVSTPVLLVFAAMTGFTPSVSRASLMTTLMALSWAVFEEYDSLTSLAFAALLMLGWNPFVINSVSFQLSVSSVAGILLFGAPLQAFFWDSVSAKKRKGLPGKICFWIIGTLSVSAGAMVFTIPLSAWYFGAVSIVSLLTNLLTLWAVSIIFVGTAAVGAFGGLLPAVSRIAAQCISWLIRYVQLVSGTISRFPFAAVYTQSGFVVIWLIFCYCLLFLFLLLGRKRKVCFAAVGAGTLVLAIVLSVLVPRLDDFRLTVLDVGEGQCILLQSEGRTMMIDCGGDADTWTADIAAQTLLSQGITRLDGIVITHCDRDHTGALRNLLTRIQVDALYLPDLEDCAFLKSISDLQLQRVMIAEDTRLPFGGGVLTLTEPGQMKTDNENCMCVLFESEKCAILITGDRSRSGEKRLIRSLDLPHVDILIGGHHGAKTSTSVELLEAVTPDIVIFSAGKNNNYGHPAQEVLDRVAAYHCTVYRTDLDGSVVIRR